jgi:hypothetical protein
MAAVLEAGGQVYYSHQSARLSDEPSWLRGMVARALGPEWAYSIRGVIFYPDANKSADEIVRSASQLTDLDRITIWPGGRGATRLSDQAPGGLTDEGVDYLLATFPRLKHLSTTAARISDAKINELLEQSRWTGLQISRDSAGGREVAVDTWTYADGTQRIVDLRKTDTRVRELINELVAAGFKLVPDGNIISHRKFTHKNYSGVVTLDGGDDYAPRVQVEDVKRAIEEVAN